VAQPFGSSPVEGGKAADIGPEPGDLPTHSPTELSSYNAVAEEYYNQALHPTCADFRDASHALLIKTLREFRPPVRSYCDVGCGDSLLCELFATKFRYQRMDIVDLVDSSDIMLGYSDRNWSNYGAHPNEADARDLPLESSSVSFLLASLGDPYNDDAFWKEASRVLEYDGIGLFTTPSWDWVRHFRANDDHRSAIFQLSDGRSVRLPSIVLSCEEQVSLIEDCKLVVEETYDFTISQLSRSRPRSKIMPERGPNASVVTGYVVRKR
jgi:SAM-dependent methyltransferase